VRTSALQVLCCGITPQLVEQVIRRHRWPARLVDDLCDADVVLSVRQGLGRASALRREAKDQHVPILVIKADTLPQIERALERLLSRRASAPEPNAVLVDLSGNDDELAGLEECRLAIEQVVMPQGRPVELVPRTERVRGLQAELVSRYRLRCDVFGQAEHGRLRVFPP
jgi:hypothetical protein